MKKEKELIKKYTNPYALMGNREKLWLCENSHFFEKTSKKVFAEVCPECGGIAYQPAK